jgi:hypothetical protein
MTFQIPEADHGHPLTIGSDVEPLIDEAVDQLNQATHVVGDPTVVVLHAGS